MNDHTDGKQSNLVEMIPTGRLALQRFCSFCGRRQAETDVLVVGGSAMICDICVARAAEVVAATRALRDAPFLNRKDGDTAASFCKTDAHSSSVVLRNILRNDGASLSTRTTPSSSSRMKQPISFNHKKWFVERTCPDIFIDHQALDPYQFRSNDGDAGICSSTVRTPSGTRA